MRKAIETNNGLKGGLLKGKAHYDSNGNPLGGIKAIVTDQGGKPIEVEGNEVIINKKTVQSDKILTVKGTPKEILSTLNQMDGNGVAIGDEEAEILAKYRTGGELITYKNKYNKKYGYSINESHDLEEISNDTGISIKGLQEIYNKGIGAYKTNPTSVRPNVKSKEQWAMARVYSAVMGGKASIVDKKELNIRFKTGGSIKPNLSKMTPSELKEFYASPEGKKLDAQTYAEWKRLVNMTKSELEKFYNSVEGKKAGLSSSEANRQGIDSGRESARWIMKMKDIPYTQWTSNMWRWAKKQINFIKRMSGMKGSLYDEKGNKTRKHTALLIWGHNPEQKFRGGGELSQKALAVETNDLTDFVRKYFIKDGRIDVSDAMQELFGNKGGKSIADEYRKRIGLHKKGGLTISQLAHKLWEEHRDEVREGIDDSDFRNAIEEVLISEYGVSSMINSLIEKSSESEEDKENEYWMRRYGEDEDYYDDYYEDLTDEEVADYFRDMEGFERELAKGTEHEMEHLDTLKKVAEGKLTPEEGVVETASKHLEENPQYYEDLAKMELEALKDKLKNQGYNVTIPSGGNRISVIGYGKGYFNAKKQKADSILSSLKRNGYNAVSKLDTDGYYDFWVYADEPKKAEQEESIPDLIEGLKVLADSLEGAEKKEIEDVIEGLEILLESDSPEVIEKKSDKIKVIFPNTDSGYDKDAQKFILDFIKRYKGAKLAKHADENKNYELYVIYDNSYPSESEIYVTDSIEKAYNKSLDVDVRELNIVKAKKNNETIIYDYYNGDIFGNYMGEKYDEKGDLKKEVKEKVINNIKRHFNRDWEGNLVEGTVLWATKIGEPDWNEQIITENASQIEDAKKWALANGFDRIRVSRIDMSSKPDFTKGFKKYAEGGELNNNSMFFEMSKADQDQEKRIMENQFGKNI